jgi:SnoaL-like polyketide cyclase
LSRRLRDLAPNGIDGYVDTFGSGNVSLAVSLGVEPDRINTLIDQEAVQRFGVRSDAHARQSRPHLGDFLGIAPTGKTIQFKTVDAMRVRNGKITEHWGVANLYSVPQQLGQLPPT